MPMGQETAEVIRAAQARLESADLASFLHDRARPLILQNVRDNFTSSVSPDGVQWPARKIVGDGHPLLIDTGALLQAATGGGAGHVSQIGPRSMALGVDESIPYAAIHNYGGETRPMPQREYMGASEATEEEIAEALADYLLPTVLGG